jgi:methylated-DNA-[protein]-cysteine S-methyltransferase
MKTHASKMESPIGHITIFANELAVNEITFKETSTDGLIENAISILAVEELRQYFAGTLKTFSFPIEQSGTDFQRAVWHRLCDITYGNTLSYAKFAAHQPLAIRAIAAANGKNNIAIAVPCHRVIGSNGKLVGYAGGLWRKQWLLAHEREMSGIGQAALKFT